MRASSTSFVGMPPEPFENTHDGFWLCQTSVWPRTFMLLVIAKLTIASAPLYVKLFSLGSSDCHFISFSAVTLLKWAFSTGACVVYDCESTAAPIGKEAAYFAARPGMAPPIG